MIKAIETSYKGSLFRSRLEARWAIAFDVLGLPWQYEVQGFDLGDAGLYLPDFWVPYPYGDGWGEWVEVKPEPPTDEECAKLAALAEQSGHRAYCVCGQPWPGEHQVWVWQHHHAGRPESIPLIAGAELREVPFGPDYVAIGIASGNAGFCFPSSHHRFSVAGDLMAAFRAARSARFEHGETPNLSAILAGVTRRAAA
jgi:nucleotide-binding universal stress UspA family protein